jgi:hypothetical protein
MGANATAGGCRAGTGERTAIVIVVVVIVVAGEAAVFDVVAPTPPPPPPSPPPPRPPLLSLKDCIPEKGTHWSARRRDEAGAS